MPPKSKKSAPPASTPATPRKADRPHPYATPTSGLSKNKKFDSTRASQRDQYPEGQEWTPPEANLAQPGTIAAIPASPSKRTADRMLANKKTVHETSETTLSLPVSDKEMEVLRQFDLDMKFGPNVGLTRLARWERAQKFQLDPPSKVLEILNGHGRQSVTEIRESIWHEL